MNLRGGSRRNPVEVERNRNVLVTESGKIKITFRATEIRKVTKHKCFNHYDLDSQNVVKFCNIFIRRRVKNDGVDPKNRIK